MLLASTFHARRAAGRPRGRDRRRARPQVHRGDARAFPSASASGAVAWPASSMSGSRTRTRRARMRIAMLGEPAGPGARASRSTARGRARIDAELEPLRESDRPGAARQLSRLALLRLIDRQPLARAQHPVRLAEPLAGRHEHVGRLGVERELLEVHRHRQPGADRVRHRAASSPHRLPATRRSGRRPLIGSSATSIAADRRARASATRRRGSCRPRGRSRTARSAPRSRGAASARRRRARSPRGRPARP